MVGRGDGINANGAKPPLLIALLRSFTLGKLRWLWLLLLFVVVVLDGATLLRHPGIILYPLVVHGVWLLFLFALSYPLYRFTVQFRAVAFGVQWLFVLLAAATTGIPRLLEDSVELEHNPALTFILICSRALWLIAAFTLMRLWLDDVAERADKQRARLLAPQTENLS